MRNDDDVAIRRIAGGFARRVIVVAAYRLDHRAIGGSQDGLTEAIVILGLAAHSTRSGE